MDQKISVVYVSSELSPLAKSGELADVAGSLPKYLVPRGLEVSVFLPKYRLPEIEALPQERVLTDLVVPLGEKKIKAQVFKMKMAGHDVFLIDNPSYFWRDGIYGTGKGEYLDNDERYIFFNRAVLEYLLKTKTPVDIIHCNSWQTALIPVFVKTHYAQKGRLKRAATLLTLHNVSYQGEFPPETLALTGLNWDFFSPTQLALNGRFNFLKAGILYSDVINTVSSSYKRDIQTRKHGFGLERILKSRNKDFYAVHNGADYQVWNPETDPHITANYSSGDLGPKKKCKQDLIDEFGLCLDEKEPVLGIFSYLTKHKGLDLLVEGLDELMSLGIGLAVLGQGDEKYEKKLEACQKKYPGKMAFRKDSLPSLAHKLMAGLDIFLMPSLYEPCGLNQLYAFRYGTVPVVRATGGLAETVKTFDEKNLSGNGFVFDEYTTAAFLKTLKRALDVYGKPEIWASIVKTGLEENFSWEKAAQRYHRLYLRAVEKKRGGQGG